MLSAVTCRPVVAESAALLQRHFGIVSSSTSELNSYNDRNWHVQTATPRQFADDIGNGIFEVEYVMKVHNSVESADTDTIEVSLVLLTIVSL